MPHEILALGPYELSIAMVCLGHALAAEDSAIRRAQDSSRDGMIPLPIPVYQLGGL